MKKYLYPVFFVVFVFLLLGNSKTAYSAETSVVGIYPAEFRDDEPTSRAWFQLDLKPGETYRSSVVVWNKGQKKTSFALYSVDATTSTDGAFGVSKKGTVDDLGGWIDLDSSSITLLPGEKREIGFSVGVPENAVPGSHAAGLMVESDEDTSNNNGIHFVSRVGVRVYVVVEGEIIEKIELGKPVFDNIFHSREIVFPIINSGNIEQYFNIEGNVVGFNKVGKLAFSQEKVVLAGKNSSLDLPVDIVLPIFANLNISYGVDVNNLSHDSTKYVYGFGLVPFALMLSLFLIFLTRMIRNRT